MTDCVLYASSIYRINQSVSWLPQVSLKKASPAISSESGCVRYFNCCSFSLFSLDSAFHKSQLSSCSIIETQTQPRPLKLHQLFFSLLSLSLLSSASMKTRRDLWMRAAAGTDHLRIERKRKMIHVHWKIAWAVYTRAHTVKYYLLLKHIINVKVTQFLYPCGSSFQWIVSLLREHSEDADEEMERWRLSLLRQREGWEWTAL